MKLAARDVNSYFQKPDPNSAGILIFGMDAMRVALKRQQIIGALVGPNGEEEMRLTRISAGEIRKSATPLIDAIKAMGFFPGTRVVFVEGVADSNTKAITAALDAWEPGDAGIVATAGSLTARSALRKIFEGHRSARAAGIYDDPPSMAEIEAKLATQGLAEIDKDAKQDLVDLSRVLGPGDFDQTLEKLSLYKIDDPAPVNVEDVQACSPQSIEAALDDVLNCVAEGRKEEIGPIVQRLESQGIQAVGLCIGATRHFRTLHAAASDRGGASVGITRLRPPVFGPRRDRMARQAQNWGVHKLEMALEMLTDTDLTLRSTSHSPQMALVERTLIRLAMLASR